MIEDLVARGLVERSGNGPRAVYAPTAAGRAAGPVPETVARFAPFAGGRSARRGGGSRPGTRARQARARAASSTASAWPGTFTFGQTRAIRPSRSTSTVVRSTPIYVRPYMLFSTQTP